MKTFILACFLALFSPATMAQETDNGQVIVDIDSQDDEQYKSIGVADMVETVVEVGDYFNKNYPDDKIDSDLKPDIKKFFPNLTTQELYDKESLIRKSVKIFRWGKDKFAEIKSAFLAPKEPELTYRDEDYEKASDYTYVDVGQDKTRVVTDIKKVISYSVNLKEQKNYEDYAQRHENTAKAEAMFPEIVKLKRIWDKIELKKLPFYGTIYPDPKTDGEGITPWLEQKHAKLRLASAYSRLEGNHQLKSVAHIKLDAGWVLLAQKYDRHPPISIKFNGSQNLAQCRFFYPAPHRIVLPDGDLVTYANNFGAPIECDVVTPDVPALLSAQITYSLCNEDKLCLQQQADLNLEIKNGSGFSTVMQNFITQSFNHLPNSGEDGIAVQDVSVENNEQSPSGQTLRIIIDSDSTIANPDIFVNAGNNVLFGSPRIAIDGKRISARIDIISPNAELEGKEIELTILPDSIHTYRLRKTVLSSSVFDINSKTLNLGLLLLAVLGGFLLNFMPCVFPVLSLKILSLTRFGAKTTRNIKTDFSLSIAGIFSGFWALAVVLSVLKILGRNLGWGLQFQNPYFVIVMIFAIMLFLAQINNILPWRFRTPEVLQKQKFTPKWDSFFSGLLVVIMATPCTGPYLGTTIGFALAGSPLDIFAILSAVACGLALPYMVLLIAPDLSVFIPTPGEWMQKLQKFMSLMLVLTLIWLFCILAAQSSAWTISGIVALSVVFYLTVYLYYQSLREVEIVVGKQQEVLARGRRSLHLMFGTILILWLIAALALGGNGFAKHQQQNAAQNVQQLDFNQIGQYVANGENVLVRVGADWCLTCSYNNILVFNNKSVEKFSQQYNLRIITLDWTEYNPEILAFMSEYGRRGLPFYILYSRKVPEGLVLPEILSQMEFENILRNAGVITQQND